MTAPEPLPVDLARGVIIEGCAGPGGWSTALRLLGRDDAVGVELDRDACRTAVAAGHRRVQADVATLPLAHLAGRVEGVVMSPPCQAFSRAGKRLGLLDQPALYAHLRAVARAGRWVDYDPAGWADRRSPLVLQPVRWVDALRPAWLACEQVPDVLPLWRQVAVWLRSVGYSTACGLLSAERFGVPQTRTRAFLVARLGGPVSLPSATHEAYAAGRPPAAPGLFGALLPWVSMADALGWHADRPARTVCGHRSPRWAYGAGKSSYATGWTLETEQRSETAAGRVPITREAGQPAPTLVANARSREWSLTERQANGADRPIDTPVPTITAAADNGNFRWTYRNGNQDRSAVRDQDEPAPTVHFGPKGNAVDWVGVRPAPTLTVWQAGVLQSFPADYPWQGTRTAQYRQVGDAVPPLLAAAVLGELLGVDWRRRLWGLEDAA